MATLDNVKSPALVDTILVYTDNEQCLQFEIDNVKALLGIVLEIATKQLSEDEIKQAWDNRHETKFIDIRQPDARR